MTDNKEYVWMLIKDKSKILFLSSEVAKSANDAESFLTDEDFQEYLVEAD